MENIIIEELKKKIKQYENDLKLILEASKKTDKIKTARVKVRFEDMMVENIKDLTSLISDLKEFIKSENTTTRGAE